MMYFIGMVSFSFFFLSSCTAYDEIPAGRSTEYEIFHYRKGDVEKVLKNEEMIIKEAECLFLGSDDTYRLIVGNELLADIKKFEAIEVVYKRAKVFQSDFLRKEIEISRLLIPLEGKFASPYTTVFYGNPDYGEFNVLANKKGVPVLGLIKKLLK
ncbi:MAG: hypothetical protein CV087_00415 [Candidatus Brocadia sp. WS118]|nr:MAG: hypothetical protein CV087_00415 [Candidatus Brocadia sp. WS118]